MLYGKVISVNVREATTPAADDVGSGLRFPPLAERAVVLRVREPGVSLEEEQVDSEADLMQGVRDTEAVLCVPLRLLGGAPGFSERRTVAERLRVLDEPCDQARKLDLLLMER